MVRFAVAFGSNTGALALNYKELVRRWAYMQRKTSHTEVR